MKLATRSNIIIIHTYILENSTNEREKVGEGLVYVIQKSLPPKTGEFSYFFLVVYTNLNVHDSLKWPN